MVPAVLPSSVAAAPRCVLSMQFRWVTLSASVISIKTSSRRKTRTLPFVHDQAQKRNKRVSGEKREVDRHSVVAGLAWNGLAIWVIVFGPAFVLYPFSSKGSLVGGHMEINTTKAQLFEVARSRKRSTHGYVRSAAVNVSYIYLSLELIF